MSAPGGWRCRRCDLHFEVLSIAGRRPRATQGCPNCGRATKRAGAVRPARARREPEESTGNAIEALDWERRRAAEDSN